MLTRSRRYEDAADRVYDAMLQQYDAPGDDPQQQRDLFLQVRFGDSRLSCRCASICETCSCRCASNRETFSCR